MSDTPQPESSDSAQRSSLLRNWISLAGGIIAASSVFAFVLLFTLDLTGRGASNPYLGILCYVVAPGFLFLGALIAGLGAWRERRLRSTGKPSHAPRLSIDFSRPRDRRILLWFTLCGGTFLLITAIGSYQTFVYTESNQFCGEVCHNVMGPEYTAYHRSTHAKVACVECHVGSGASSYLKAKINGTHQLLDVITAKYDRPIATPVHNMRAASDTCEQCHWRQKYSGVIEKVSHRFLSDKTNTAFTTKLLVNVGGGDPAHGPVGGIHWHMNVNSKTEFYATDPQRQTIVWIKTTKADGSVTVYRTADFKGEPDPAQVRTMDCMDCHNRPAHRYQSPNDAVDEALYLGRIDSGLPEVKRTLVDLLTKPYTTQDEGVSAVAKGLKDKFGDTPRVQAAVAAASDIFRGNFFPEMNANWSKYPDNIGHLDSSGCFRCHDGKHMAVGNAKSMPATDCNTCHTLIAQGAGSELMKVAPEGVAFKHPSTDIEGTGLLCADCHNGKNQDN